MARKLSFVCVALLMVAAVAFSQAPLPPPPPPAPPPPDVEPSDVIIRTETALVNVLATVRTKKGALVANLEKDQFQLLEDGKEREIRYFTRETDLPLTIGMLIDTSGSMGDLIPVERRAGAQFFDQVLGKKDLAFLISFGKDAELLQDLTGSSRLLQNGLDDLRLNAGVGGIQPGPVPTANRAGTVMYDALFLAADERLRQETGRKVVILITDGDDQGSKMSRDEAIEAAQKADAIVYSIFFNSGFGSDEGTLKRISEATGGRVFEVDRRLNLEAIFKQIQDEMRTQYAIAFEPADPTKDGSYHKLELKTTDKDYKVQARKGYYAVENE